MKDVKKVLIITYYWPPSGGSGTQRWLKFVKYLRDFDWEPIIYTPDNPHGMIKDSSLEYEIPARIKVIKRKIWEPQGVIDRISRKENYRHGFAEAHAKRSQMGSLLLWARANFFIPDARFTWVRPSVKFLVSYLHENPVDVVVSTGPPHSMHLIALGIKKKLKLPWLADFRDPWTDFFQNKQLPFTKRTVKKHMKLEHKVLRSSDTVVTVSDSIREYFKRYNTNSHVVTNGFDGTIAKGTSLDPYFSITYTGMMKAGQNPKNLWEVLKECCVEIPSFQQQLRVQFIGMVDGSIEKQLRLSSLKDNVQFIGYQDYGELNLWLNRSQLLLVTLFSGHDSKGILTGKVFEYLAAKRPVMAIGPVEGDLAKLLEKTKAGNIFDFNEKSLLKEHIINCYNSYKNGTLVCNSIEIGSFHRKKLTERLSLLLNSMR